MPREILKIEDLGPIIERAIECRTKRVGDMVKLKFRTKKCLYTIKVTPEEAAQIESDVSSRMDILSY